jgi:hypothetical protein
MRTNSYSSILKGVHGKVQAPLNRFGFGNPVLLYLLYLGTWTWRGLWLKSSQWHNFSLGINTTEFSSCPTQPGPMLPSSVFTSYSGKCVASSWAAQSSKSCTCCSTRWKTAKLNQSWGNIELAFFLTFLKTCQKENIVLILLQGFISKYRLKDKNKT